MPKDFSIADYRALSQFRHTMRCFLRFSEQAAHNRGLDPGQHQLLLAIKGLPEGVRPRIRDLAERLQIHHHSAVELANRLEAGGFVRREHGTEDRREVLLRLTPRGEKVLRQLSLHHRDELRSRGPALLMSLRHLVQTTNHERRKTNHD